MNQLLRSVETAMLMRRKACSSHAHARAHIAASQPAAPRLLHLYTPRRRNTSRLITETIFSAASVRRMMRQARGAHDPGGARSCGQQFYSNFTFDNCAAMFDMQAMFNKHALLIPPDAP